MEGRGTCTARHGDEGGEEIGEKQHNRKKKRRRSGEGLEGGKFKSTQATRTRVTPRTVSHSLPVSGSLPLSLFFLDLSASSSSVASFAYLVSVSYLSYLRFRSYLHSSSCLNLHLSGATSANETGIQPKALLLLLLRIRLLPRCLLLRLLLGLLLLLHPTLLLALPPTMRLLRPMLWMGQLQIGVRRERNWNVAMCKS